MAKQSAATSSKPQTTLRIPERDRPPKLPLPEWKLIHSVDWILLPYDLDYYGRPVPGSSWTWIRVKEVDRIWYLKIAWWARGWGYAVYSYDLMGERMECSREKARRRVRKLKNMGLLWIGATEDEEGDLGANQYVPLPAARPENAIAIVQSGKVVMLTKQFKVDELPPIPKARGRRRVMDTGTDGPASVKPMPVRPEEVVLRLPNPYQSIAQQEKVTDALTLSLAWERFQKRLVNPKLDPVGNRFGYWRDVLRTEKQQLAALAAQTVAEGKPLLSTWPANTPPPNPEAERVALMEFLIATATDLLARGADPEAVRADLPRHPFLCNFTRMNRLADSDLDKALPIAQDRAEALRQRRAYNQNVPPEWAAWVKGRANVFRQKAGVPVPWIGEYLAKDEDPLKPQGLRSWTGEQLQALYERIS